MIHFFVAIRNSLLEFGVSTGYSRFLLFPYRLAIRIAISPYIIIFPINVGATVQKHLSCI